MPSSPSAVGGDAGDERAADLAQPEEHAVQAHDRAAIVRVRLGHVREQPDRGGRRAGQHEQPEHGRHRERQQDHESAGPRCG